MTTAGLTTVNIEDTDQIRRVTRAVVTKRSVSVIVNTGGRLQRIVGYVVAFSEPTEGWVRITLRPTSPRAAND